MVDNPGDTFLFAVENMHLLMIHLPWEVSHCLTLSIYKSKTFLFWLVNLNCHSTQIL